MNMHVNTWARGSRDRPHKKNLKTGERSGTKQHRKAVVEGENRRNMQGAQNTVEKKRTRREL